MEHVSTKSGKKPQGKLPRKKEANKQNETTNPQSLEAAEEREPHLGFRSTRPEETKPATKATWKDMFYEIK